MNTIIVSGGNIGNEGLALLKEASSIYSNIIAVDKGLEALNKLNIIPNYMIGDWDSIEKDILKKYEINKKIKMIKLNPEKDYTDTHMALKLAINIGSTNITIIGGTGTRIDHMIGNIHILKEAMEKGISCKIIDENNEIQLINKDVQILKDKKYKYISLIPLTDKVEGITLKGFKYSLTKESLTIGQSLGISNEQIEDIAKIEIDNGILIFVKSKD